MAKGASAEKAVREMRGAIGRLLDRLPDLRLDPEADDVHITGEVFRKGPAPIASKGLVKGPHSDVRVRLPP